MKFLQQSESMPTEFQGLTAEEAVQRARIALGHDAPVRCWKTRRGGVLGFFSKEIFVAGVNEPAGAHKRPKLDRTISSRARDRSVDGATSGLRGSAGFELQPLLADLVESTHDELTVEGVLVSQTAFRDVLAEAEAALVDLAVTSEPVLDVMRQVQLAELRVPEESRHDEQLRSVLVALGVPSEYRSTEAVLTFDDVASSLENLPRSAPVPRDEGSVIVVVGARRDAQQSAQRLVEELELTVADLITFENTAACRQRVNRRRASRKSSVIVLEASTRLRELSEIAQQLEKLRPDFVLGAVPATLKRTDVEYWRTQLGRMDALALTRWATTASPAELMGTLPIMYVDGRRASTIRWMVLILEEMERRGR